MRELSPETLELLHGPPTERTARPSPWVLAKQDERTGSLIYRLNPDLWFLAMLHSDRPQPEEGWLNDRVGNPVEFKGDDDPTWWFDRTYYVHWLSVWHAEKCLRIEPCEVTTEPGHSVTITFNNPGASSGFFPDAPSGLG